MHSAVGKMEGVLNFLSLVFDRIFCKKKLRYYEQACINAWKELITVSAKNKLDKQIDKFTCIERHEYNLKTVFHDLQNTNYSEWGDELLFNNKNNSEKVFTGKMIGTKGDLKVSVKFAIYIHNGRFFSIEFSSEPGFISSLTDNVEIRSQNIIKNIE